MKSISYGDAGIRRGPARAGLVGRPGRRRPAAGLHRFRSATSWSLVMLDFHLAVRRVGWRCGCAGRRRKTSATPRHRATEAPALAFRQSDQSGQWFAIALTGTRSVMSMNLWIAKRVCARSSGCNGRSLTTLTGLTRLMSGCGRTAPGRPASDRAVRRRPAAGSAV